MTSTALAERGPDMEAIEQTLVGGDLSRLTPTQRVSYYNQVCRSLDLNPLTKPFAYINLNGKLVLYALKDCTEQLRSKRSISVQIVAREVVEDCYVVTARASMSTGRQDESIGAVPIANLKGESRANAFMKAETKAKRRVTLSICGLGILDETDVEQFDGPKGYVVEAMPDRTGGHAPKATAQVAVGAPSDAIQGENPATAPSDNGPDLLPPDGYVYIKHVGVTDTRNPNLKRALITVSTGETFSTIKTQLAALCEQCCQNHTPVRIESKTTAKFGEELVSVHTLQTNVDLDAEILAADLARQAGEVS
jgi:hypothetical protein